MSLILIISILVRLVAMGWSIFLLRRIRDWRMGFLTVILGLMALRQTLTLFAEKESWAISVTGHVTELPGLAVSIMAFLVMFFWGQIISERKRAEKRIEKDRLITIPWRIYFLIGSVGLIIVTMISLSFYTGIRMSATYAPLINASIKIKQEAAMAHLWFEEIISGDRKEDIQIVWEHLDQADWYAQAMLEGGISLEGTFIPLDDEQMRQKIKDVQKNLKEFRDITHQRLRAKETAGIGTEIDQRYDAIFMTFIDQADKVETRLQQIMARDLRGYQFLQVILLSSSIILTLIIGIAFYLYNRRRIEDFLAINKAKESLEQEVTERKRAEDQVLRKSTVVKAINKVLQEALVCETDEEVARTCLAVAEELTGSKFGFIDEVNKDGRLDVIAISDPGWDACKMPGSDAVRMFKDLEIRGIYGSVIMDGRSLITNNPASHPDRVGTPEGHPPLTSFLGVPLKHAGRTVGVIGLANKESGYDLADQKDVETLSVAFVEALMRKRAEKELQKRRDENTKLTVIAKERGELQDWINTFDTFVGKFDPDGKVIVFNEAPIKAGGLTKGEVVGKYFPDTKWWSHSEMERARIVECFKKANAGLSSRIETNFRSADGTPIPVIFNCQPVMDDNGKVKYITAEGKIIIEEVKLRDALRLEKESLENRVKERTSELETVNKNLREEIAERKKAEKRIRHLQSVLLAIRNINQLIVQEKNQQELLQGTCVILNQTRNYKLVWIGLIEKGTKDVLPTAQAGFEEDYLKWIKITWDDSETGKGPTGIAIKTKKPFVMRDIANDPRYKPWMEEAMKRGYASSAAIPLVYEDQVFGTLNVYATVTDSFNKEEIDLLFELSQDIAFALHNIEVEEQRKRAEEEVVKHRRDLQRLSSQLILAQESERRRISLELHDEMGQSLTAMRINLVTIEKELQSELSAKNRDRLAETRTLVDQTLEQVRELALELRPTMLDDLGLVPTLRWYVKSYSNRLNIEVNLKVIDMKERLTVEMETLLYRIVQEALTNIARHAEATKVNVHLEYKDPTIVVSIQDDGKGFDVQEIMDHEAPDHGTGLVGMRERVAVLRGNVNIQSRPEKGTKLTIKIPYKKES